MRLKLSPLWFGVFAGILLVPATFFDCWSTPFEQWDQEILDCHKALQQTLEMPDRAIPTDLIKRCRGIAIFPKVNKIGALVGVSYGRGIVLRRDEATGQWSRPAFFKIRGGSFGPQFGIQSIDLILLVMSEAGFQGLLEGKYTLGADISITAGPVGRDASAETTLGFTAGAISYSRSKGFFAGISLAGSTLEADREANGAYHGAGVSPQDVFYEGKGALSDNAGLLIRALNDITN